MGKEGVEPHGAWRTQMTAPGIVAPPRVHIRTRMWVSDPRYLICETPPFVWSSSQKHIN